MNNNISSNIENAKLLGKDENKLQWYSAKDFLEWIKIKTGEDIKKNVIPDYIFDLDKHKKRYDVAHTITTAQATNPNDYDNPNYNREPIYQFTERVAKYVTVSNDGADTLFVVISHDKTTKGSAETPVYPGENKTYRNVFELRLRSPTVGLPYRVTEYSICCNTGSAGAAARGNALQAVINTSTSGDNTIIAAPAIATQTIKIVNMFFVVSAAVTVTFKDGTTALTGAMSFAGNGGMGFNGDFNPLKMSPGNAFVINLGGNVQISGFVLYYIE